MAEGTWSGHTSPAYANMVGPFGGITAAQALNAVLQHPQRLGEPVSLTVNFCAALEDGPFTAMARPTRTNRTTQHWAIELQQQGRTMLTASAVTALPRATWSLDAQAMPAVPAPAQVAREHRVGVEWVRRYETRFLSGGLPHEWDGRDQGDEPTRMWMRDDPPRPLDHAALTALCDCFFPRIWRRRATRVPIGTVSMTIYYHADAAMLARTGSGYLLGQAQGGQAMRGGFFDEHALLWNEAGEPLASTHQVVWYKS